MSETAIIYWSGTGNTESMAFAVLEGVQSCGSSADFFKVSDTTTAAAAGYDTLILGCPAMGSEVFWKRTSLNRSLPSLKAVFRAKKLPSSAHTAGVTANG